MKNNIVRPRFGKRNPLQIAMLFVMAILTAINVYSQDNEWIMGDWNGVYLGEKSKLTKTFDSRLQITRVHGTQFEGIIQCIYPADTSIRLHTRVTGRIYAGYIMTKLSEVVYFKDPPGQYTWAKHCNACDSMKYTFKVVGDSVVLKGERHCDSLCSIIARYTKTLSAFKYKAAFMYEVEHKARMPVRTGGGTSFNFIHPIAADSLKGRDFWEGRAVKAPTRYIINTDSVELQLMDNGIVDGDTISLYYNGQLIVQNLPLKEKAFVIKLPVFKSYPNLLIVHAESLGEYPPNTALVQVLYGNKRESFLLSSNMSKSASIELVNGH